MTETQTVAPTGPLTPDELERLNAWWRAANYLSVGQIYLLDNPLLREPLRLEHVKPRLLGHWGTTPGLNFVYAHLNRVIRARDLDAIFVTGPGHGGPGLVANTYLEGTYTEVYPSMTPDEEGLRRLFRQFSFPGGIPSHVAPETPGSIHEGGELGYALVHAYGAAFDNPDLLVSCVVGDGEAETGPLAASWHSNKFLNPARDGAVLPILHLNGYKIANPTVLARIPHDELRALLVGYGYEPYFVEGDDPATMHQLMAATLDEVVGDIAAIQARAREGDMERPRWPMIVLRTPKGWTGPKEVDGQPMEGTFRAHQVPLAQLAENPEHLAALEEWMRCYRPEELFDESGRVVEEIAALAPDGDRRMGANPHANGGLLLRDLSLPDFRDYAVTVDTPGTTSSEATRVLGGCLRDVMRANPRANFRVFGPDETASNRLERGLRGHRPRLDGRASRRRRPPRPRRPGHGGPQRAPVPGLAGGLPAHRAPRPVQLLRGVHPHRRLDVQPARQVAEGHARHPVAAADRVAELPADLARLAPGPQRLLPPGPGLHRPRGQQEGRDHPRLPAAGRQHAAVGHRPLPAQPRLRQRHRGRQAADAGLAVDGRRDPALHARASASGTGPAATTAPSPTSSSACAGDVPTLETLAAAALLREHLPDLKVRVVNVVDLMRLQADPTSTRTACPTASSTRSSPTTSR